MVMLYKNMAEVCCDLHPDPILVFLRRTMHSHKINIQNISHSQEVKEVSEMKVFCVTAT